MTRPDARTASVRRATSESTVELDLDLDGTGRSHIDTSVPFFNHLLTDHNNRQTTCQMAAA